MAHLLYLALLASCLIGTAPLEIILGVRVYRRPGRLALAVLPAFIVGSVWDFYAVHVGHWDFDRRYLTGATIANLPIEELLFFVVIPTCGLLSFEAVRARRPGWFGFVSQSASQSGSQSGSRP